MIKKLMFFMAFLIGTQSIKSQDDLSGVATFFASFAKKELAAFYDYPIPSIMIMTTSTLAGTLVLYEVVNYLNKRKDKEQLTSPWAMIAPALIIGYICVKICHHALLQKTDPKEIIKTVAEMVKEYATEKVQEVTQALEPHKPTIKDFLSSMDQFSAFMPA